MSAHHIILAGLVFFAAHLLSTLTGFGANILGLPLLALVVGITPGKQSLVVLGGLLYLYILIRWHRRIDFPQLRIILVVSGIGLVVGMAIFKLLPEHRSKIALSIFVIGVGVRGLFKVAPNYRTPLWFAGVLLFVGGIVHGAFTTGGPLLVVYVRRMLPHKSVFRATLAVMWLFLALGLTIGWTLTHSWAPETGIVTLVGIPFLVVGTLVGEYLHHRFDEHRFEVVVNLTLIASGTVLLWNTLH